MINHISKYCKNTFVFVLFVFVTTIINAQTTLVLNGGITVLNGGTAGAPVYLVVNEPNTAGITRLSGHIHSENQYNFIKWIAGTGTGNYVIPFGVGGNAADYIPFTFNKTTTGSSNIELSTWQTNIPNIPHAAATNVGAVTSMTGTADSVLYALDRFWDIQTSAATTADLTFSYLGIENTTSNPTDTVKAQHWNGSSWDTQVGPGNLGVITGVGSAGPFMGQTTFSPWILSIIPTCPTATISYANNYCDNNTNPQAITFSGGLGGIYSVSPTGLAIDSVTGTVVPANSTAGTYTVTYTIDSTAVCPTFTTTTSITINATNSSPQSTAICQGDSVLLGGAYQTTAGVYNDTLSNINGCDSIISTTLAINPITSVNQNAAICQGDSILLGGSYQTVAGVYNDTLSNSNGCDSIISTTLTINPATLVNQNTSICQGDSIFLGGAFQTTAGVYNDTTIVAGGCDSVIVTTLTINPQNSIAANPTSPVCFGDTISVTATGSGTGTITWYSDANGTSVIGTGSSYSPTISGLGTYTYWVNEVGSCSSTLDSVIVVVGGVQAIINANPLTGPVPLTVFFGNGSSSGTGIGYSWNFGEGNSSTQFEPSNIYTDIGSYTVTLTVLDSVSGCSNSTTILIDAFGESALIIPNVFTPNGDGSNDIFTVDGVNLESVEGDIFNRWGQKMFSWNNVNGGWDGRTSSGTLVPDGTYFYIIKALGQDGTEYLEKGAVSLIR